MIGAMLCQLLWLRNCSADIVRACISATLLQRRRFLLNVGEAALQKALFVESTLCKYDAQNNK